MKLLKMMIVLALPLCVACRSAQTPAPVPEPATGPANEPQLPPRPPLVMTIKPAAATAPGGQRVPLEFTIRNTGRETVHACLTSGRGRGGTPRPPHRDRQARARGVRPAGGLRQRAEVVLSSLVPGGPCAARPRSSLPYIPY